ncbi:MAG: bifunctional demethylmenaquinone methyltransferase/2-methoxy-6-polyprenyl-1,4-benzoquinol methylase UbiE [Myxococcales bacterium]|nr:bifunctional demethylmenaquinone methyltransferase/2-methoxy-6-polyprenyl-1,4-benzoquinol methylase UbiE [Myxococcales bacterium]MCB9581150.1 bifunctional demethylmenaquinone methyltransferase/2-methoxy-6-polyprenyl-1,4-benzoquinol methylase UbiE [Polyangiaceae bacterium]
MTETEPRGGSGEMFDAIAPRYDLMNRLLSLGIDQSWRRQAVAALELADDARVLDLATGTGDLAIQIARTHPTCHVVGLDPSENMLAVGRDKLGDLGERVELVAGDAQALPFEDDTFDGVTIAFGIRNVVDRPAALREMARVTRDSGRVAILELSEPRDGLMAPFARFHVHTVVPFLGSLLSGHREYRYLQRSIAAFPPAEEFAATMDASGLEVLEARRLSFGVCHLYIARPRVK